MDHLIQDKNYFQCLRYIPKILLAIIIPIFDGFYHKVAVWLNDMGKRLIDHNFHVYEMLNHDLFPNKKKSSEQLFQKIIEQKILTRITLL